MLPTSVTASFAEFGDLISRSRNSESQPARVRAASNASIAASYGALSGHSAGACFCLAGAWAIIGETATAAANVIRTLAILRAGRVLVLLLNSSFIGGMRSQLVWMVGLRMHGPSHLLHFADQATERILKDFIITNCVEAWVQHH